MIQSSPLFHKPKSILAAKNILFAVIFLGVIFILFIGVNIGYQDPSASSLWIAGVASLAILFLLVRFMERGKRWARNIFLVYFICETILVLFSFQSILKGNIFLATVFLIGTFLQGFALKLLFSKKSAQWFVDVHYSAEHT